MKKLNLNTNIAKVRTACSNTISMQPNTYSFHKVYVDLWRKPLHIFYSTYDNILKDLIK